MLLLCCILYLYVVAVLYLVFVCCILYLYVVAVLYLVVVLCSVEEGLCYKEPEMRTLL